MLKKIVAVAGPTASGKTALALKIAERFDGEVVSCDSMQIYRHMDVGTAKPSIDEMERIPHHMIDIVEPSENYSVADFVERARACIDDIISRGKLPVLAGGTGLYMDSIIENIEFGDFGSDEEFRCEMERLAEEQGNEAVHKLLKEKDPEAAEKIHPNNVRRVIRALEVCKLTGKTFTQVNMESRRQKMYDALIFAIDTQREVLYERINNRVDRMLEEGLLEEVQGLRDMGIGNEHTAMQAIGYKELMEFLDGDCNFDEAVEKIKQESRRYAKRQITWFKRNKDIQWVSVSSDEDVKKVLQKCFTFVQKSGIINVGETF